MESSLVTWSRWELRGCLCAVWASMWVYTLGQVDGVGHCVRPSCQPGITTASPKLLPQLPCCLDALAPCSSPGLCWVPEGLAPAALVWHSSLSTVPVEEAWWTPPQDGHMLTKGVCGGVFSGASLWPDCLTPGLPDPSPGAQDTA